MSLRRWLFQNDGHTRHNWSGTQIRTTSLAPTPRAGSLCVYTLLMRWTRRCLRLRHWCHTGETLPPCHRPLDGYGHYLYALIRDQHTLQLFCSTASKAYYQVPFCSHVHVKV